MTKEQWEQSYQKLSDLYSKFSEFYGTSKSGKNKKIRDEAQRHVDNAIFYSCLHITERSEIYFLLTGEDSNDTARAYEYDDFKKPYFFNNDMVDLLGRIREKIESLEN